MRVRRGLVLCNRHRKTVEAALGQEPPLIDGA